MTSSSPPPPSSPRRTLFVVDVRTFLDLPRSLAVVYFPFFDLFFFLCMDVLPHKIMMVVLRDVFIVIRAKTCV